MKERLNEVAKFVQDRYNDPDNIRYYTKYAEEGLWPSEKQVIQKYFIPGSAILDLGCGTGRTTVPLVQQGYKVIGVDITPEMIDAAKGIAQSKNLQIDYRVGNAIQLDFRDNTFDGVLFAYNGWNVIPSYEDRLQAFKEVYRVLKPGGHFIFTSHMVSFKRFPLFWAKKFLKFHLAKLFGIKIVEKELGDFYFWKTKTRVFPVIHFVHLVTVKEMRQVIAQSGLKLVYSEDANVMENKPYESKWPLQGINSRFFVCKK